MALRLNVYKNLLATYLGELDTNATEFGKAITEVRALEEQLRVAKLAAEALNNARQKMLGEIRGVRGIIRTMEDAEKLEARAVEDGALE
jgi:hypothetical protein